MFIIHYLTYLFLFRIVLTEKYKSIKAIEDDFYHKIIEAKWTGAVARRCSIKKVFLEISQNSQENTCVRVSFLIKFSITLLKEGLWHRYFPVNFGKFLRTSFYIEHLRPLFLNVVETSN